MRFTSAVPMVFDSSLTFATYLFVIITGCIIPGNSFSLLFATEVTTDTPGLTLFKKRVSLSFKLQTSRSSHSGVKAA